MVILLVGDEGSLAVHIEHVEVVSKGDPHEENADEGDSAYGTSIHTGTISDQTTTSKESQVLYYCFVGIIVTMQTNSSPTYVYSSWIF